MVMVKEALPQRRRASTAGHMGSLGPSLLLVEQKQLTERAFLSQGHSARGGAFSPFYLPWSQLRSPSRGV